MKKVFVLFIAITMLGAFLTGCQSSPTPAATVPAATPAPVASATPEVTPAPTQAPLSGTIEITVPSGDFTKYMTEFAKPYFESANPGVTIDVTAEGTWDTFVARIAANNLPNIYACPFGGSFMQIQKTGKLLNLNTIADAQSVLSEVNPAYVVNILGGVYNVPWLGTTQLMIYNRDLFKQAGLDPDKPPQTWDEFLKDAQAIGQLPPMSDGTKIYGADMWNAALDWGNWYWTCLAQIYYNFNNGQYQLFNSDGTDIVFDQPNAHFKDFLDCMVQLQKYVPPDGREFYNRNVGLDIQCGTGNMADMLNAKNGPMVVGQDVGLAPIPTVNAGDTHWSTMDGRNLVIFDKGNDSDNQNSWAMVKYLMQPQSDLQACETIGEIPLIDSLKSDPFFEQPFFKAFLDQSKNTLINESNAYATQVETDILATYKECVVDGKITTDQAVQQMADLARKDIASAQTTAN